MHHSHKHLHKVAKKKNKKTRENIVLAVSVIYPLTTLGQVAEIFKNQSAANISLHTYALYIFFTLILLWYGVAEKLKPIIVLQALWLVMYSAVLVGIFLYR
jgi:uncharacterized protein with PQ loop repeat